eukprot:13644160-Alexandrium_andersonii.AAC.1
MCIRDRLQGGARLQLGVVEEEPRTQTRRPGLLTEGGRHLGLVRRRMEREVRDHVACEADDLGDPRSNVLTRTPPTPNSSKKIPGEFQTDISGQL